jgi:undecaprenyl-diphosphatase
MISFFSNLDTGVNASMSLHLSPLLQSVATWTSTIADAEVLIAVAAVLIVYMIFRKKWHDAAMVALAIGSTAGTVLLFKDFFMRARPDNALQVIVNDPSFPSGHASMAAAFFVILMFVCVSKIRSSVRRVGFIIISLFLILLVGISRLILNVHWATDVLAGWALGTASAFFSAWIVRKYLTK